MRSFVYLRELVWFGKEGESSSVFACSSLRNLLFIYMVNVEKKTRPLLFSLFVFSFYQLKFVWVVILKVLFITVIILNL
jgi:hypothetical protein